MSVSDSDKESINSSSSEEGEIWKLGSGKIFDVNNNHGKKKLKQHTESFLSLDDCINAKYNYESLRSCLISQSNSNKNYVKILNLLRRKMQFLSHLVN